MGLPTNMTSAIYGNPGVEQYCGNPLIEALPPIMTTKQVRQGLTGSVTFDPSDIFVDGSHRVHIISQLLDNFFQPLASHLQLETKISIMLRQGYVGRNLGNGSLNTHLQNGYERVMTGDLEVFQFNHAKSTAHSLSLIGCSGSGKSSTLNRILATYPQVIFHEKYNFTQVVYLKVDCPHDGSLKQLCNHFFEEIDKVLNTDYTRKYTLKRHTVETLMALMSQIANVHAIGVLVIDEIQHLSTNKSGGVEKMLNFFVTLVNVIGLPVVMVGTPKARAIFEMDLRSARRSAGFGALFWEPMQAPTIIPGQEQIKSTEWGAFTDKLWQYQWLQKRDEALTEEMRQCWYDLSQGVLDIVVKLFVLAQLRAIVTRIERVTPQLMKKVYEDELKPVHPMLAALRSGDPELIIKYSDLTIRDIDKKILALSTKLAFEHTLFPLYAPFTTKERRKQCLEKMAANSNGAIHLMLGVAASRLKQARYLRYCPKCLQQQLNDQGEYYWKRQWQVMGADCCLEHGQLLEASINRHDYHRHQFSPASPATCPAASQPPALPPTIKVARQIDCLLHHDCQNAATFAQWSRFYHGLAGRAGCLAGRQIRHETIRERVLTRWPTTWLSVHGLAIQQTEADWLRSVFRKHRKAFSYLEHIVVLDSFLPDGWQIDEVLAEVGSIRLGAEIPIPDMKISDDCLTEQTTKKRAQWLTVTAQNSVKQVRSRNAALYAWLYRHDKAWLLSVNSQSHVAPVGENRRVDWRYRDFSVCRQLFKVYKRYKALLDAPRMSRNWYLSKLDNSATVEKNLRKMPLTNAFFRRHCEAIQDYQIRRLNQALNSLQPELLRRWRLLRLAGLSEERLTAEARCWLDKSLESH